MQEEEPEEQTTPRPDRTESPLGEGAEEFLRAELSEVAQRAGDYPEVEVGASPLPIPDVPEPIEVGMDPDPVLMVGMDPDPVLRGEPGSPIDEVSTIPLPIPDPGGEVSDTPIPIPGETPVDEVSTLPTPLPSPVEDSLDEVSTLPLPLPNPDLEDGFGEVGVLPIPTPYEANLVEDNVAAGLDEELFEEPLE